ncbi:TRAP transporter substrate-binding protein [Hwanghaeella sp.]|uniref:TRAP transporter substrate-binding protein n=1 Tax=Hwanghaeella sp. TaxID=2605943 RepID=UPI003CCC1DB2
MKRRQFLKGATAVAGAAAAVSTLASPAIAQGKRELKLVTTWPKNFPGLGTGAQRFADSVTAATDGRLTVKLFAAGELVPPFESFDAVSTGAADMYHGAEYYWQGKHKAYNFFTAVPFGFTANEIDAWIYYGGGQELWDELGEQFNIKGLPCGNTGVQMGGWFNKEIKSLEDFKGLKIRMPGLGGEVLRRIGASAIALPGGEIFPSLQSGAIDATEWVGPWNDLAFGFYKVTKYYYWPGFHEPGSSLAVGINGDVWKSFSDADKALVQACAAGENNRSYAEFNARNNDALTTLVKKHGVQMRQMPEDVLNAIGEASGQVVAEVAQVDDISKRIYESFIAFRRQSIAWSKISDQAYWNARLLPFKYEQG